MIICLLLDLYHVSYQIFDLLVIIYTLFNLYHILYQIFHLLVPIYILLGLYHVLNQISSMDYNLIYLVHKSIDMIEIF